MSAKQRLRYQLSMTPLRIPITAYRHRDVRPEDVLMASYPRAGSTWLRFLLQEVLTGEPSSFANTNRVIPQVGFHGDAFRLPAGGRFIKTHEAYRKQYRRAVYLARDPRDVMLSEYAFQKALGINEASLDEYIEKFVFHHVSANGSWKEHVSSWQEAAKQNADIRIFRFEDLRNNTPLVLRQILNFLGVVAEERVILEAIQNNGVAQMRAKELKTPQKTSKDGRFVREGSPGGWRKNLTPAQANRVADGLEAEMKQLGYARGDELLEKLS